MRENNVVTFPRTRPFSKRQDVKGRNRTKSASRWLINAIHKSLRWLIMAAAWKLLCGLIGALLIAAWLGRLMFGILSLGFLGKLCLRWGSSSVWGPAAEFAASLLIFCVLSALLAWVKSLAPADPVAPVVRLSLADRLLLLSRR